MSSDRLRVAYSSERILLGDLAERVAPIAELVDLSKVSRDTALVELSTADVLLHHSRLTVDAPLLDAAPRLRAVLASGAGYDGVDLDAASSRGVLVTNQAGGNAGAVAEHAFGLLLSLRKRICEADRAVRRGMPANERPLFLNHEISGGFLGVVGYGAIGRATARIGVHGFGMTAIAFDPFVTRDDQGLAEMAPLEEVLGAADVVSLSVPLTDGTRDLIGDAEFRSMRSSAVFINTSRGGVVDQAALVRALGDGSIAGAGLDVFDGDHLPLGHPLLSMENVVLSPHIAGATYESQTRRGERQATAIQEILRGQVPTAATVLNPNGVDRFVARFG